jgi:hypothetical protein
MGNGCELLRAIRQFSKKAKPRPIDAPNIQILDLESSPKG